MELGLETGAKVIEISNKIRIVNRRIRAAVAAGEVPDRNDTEEMKILCSELEKLDNGNRTLFVDCDEEETIGS